MEELTLEATIENIPVVEDFVHNSLDALPCSMKTVMQLDIAIDELFGNIAHYAYKEVGMATVKVNIIPPSTVEIIFIDKGIPYNPLERDDPDITVPLADRQIGGLGIFMVKKTMDGMSYERKDGKNILTIQKNVL